MFEKYFIKPATIDRFQESWIAAQIESYLQWLDQEGYAAKTIWRRVPIAYAFGEFAWKHGARIAADLPGHVDGFVGERVARHEARFGPRKSMAKEVRGPVVQMLSVVLPDFDDTGRRRNQMPFVDVLPGFFDYLSNERGLRPSSLRQYRHHLSRFEAYLSRVGATALKEVSPTLLAGFMVERSGAGLSKSTVRSSAGVLRVFLRYAHRQGAVDADLSESVGWPQFYRLSSIPRSISWEEVNRTLAGVERRSPVGRRDYAILLLLVTYGLRAREIAALTLDDIDWKQERLTIPERKAGHFTAFPLSVVVGDAIVDYLRHGRPDTHDRHVFFRALAPQRPITSAAVSGLARRYLLAAGVDVARPGSHTLRHTAVQRLVEADTDLKTIGDFIGHRSTNSTKIYAKVAIEALREVALGDGEEVLS